VRTCPECEQLLREVHLREAAYGKAVDEVATGWKTTAREFMTLQRRADETMSQLAEARNLMKEHHLECRRSGAFHRPAPVCVSTR